MRLAARVDANQAEIVDALRKIGATVQPLHTVGGGCPDLLVGYKRKNFLMEVKDDGGKLTRDQKSWHSGWQGSAHIVWSAEDALKVLRYWGES